MPHYRILGTLVLLFSTVASTAAPAQTDKGKPKTAKERFKNIQVLGDVPADQWFETMSFFADSMGATCDHCHASKFDSDEKAAKNKARQMIIMVRAINEKYFPGTEPRITCSTCHRGS